MRKVFSSILLVVCLATFVAQATAFDRLAPSEDRSFKSVAATPAIASGATLKVNQPSIRRHRSADHVGAAYIAGWPLESLPLPNWETFRGDGSDASCSAEQRTNSPRAPPITSSLNS